LSATYFIVNSMRTGQAIVPQVQAIPAPVEEES
jgi:hypothetical protein